MLQLIRHELYKLLKGRGIWLGVLLCMGVYALYAYYAAPSFYNSYRNAYNSYQPGEGKVTPQKLQAARKGIKQLKQLYDRGVRFSDDEVGRWLLYNDIETTVVEHVNHLERINTLGSNLKQNPNDQKSIAQLGLLKKVGPVDTARYVKGWESLIVTWSGIGHYLVILLAIFGMSRVFPEEKTSGMDTVIASTREGRRKLVLAKLLAGIGFLFVIMALFTLAGLLANAFIYGLPGWAAPVKNIFHETPYAMGVAKLWLLQSGLAFGVTMVFGLLAMLVSVLTGNSVAAFLGAGAAYWAFDYISGLVMKVLPHGTAGYLVFDFTKLSGVGKSYQDIYMVGGNVLMYETMLAIVIVGLILLFGAGVFITCRGQGTRKLLRNLFRLGGIKR